MKNVRKIILIITICLCFAAKSAFAFSTTVSFLFSGFTASPLGNIPENTPFTGTFSYDYAASGVTTPYFGGTETVFATAFTALTLTIGNDTVSEIVPGPMSMFDNINPPDGFSPGDSLYTFNSLEGNVPNASTGSIAAYGLTPDSMYLGFADLSGTAFSGTSLPSTLSLSEFSSQEVFLVVYYGPMGPGNMGGSLDVTSLTQVPEPRPGWMLLFGVCVVMRVRNFRLRRPSSFTDRMNS